MVTAGRATTRTLDDGWTVVTADGSRAAHFEHTVAITDNGPEILTLPLTGPDGHRERQRSRPGCKHRRAPGTCEAERDDPWVGLATGCLIR